MFAQAGVWDTLYAFGIAPQKLPRVLALRATGCDLVVVLASPAQAAAVAEAFRRAGDAILALIETDCDGHRSRLRADDPAFAAIGRILATCPAQALSPDSGAPVLSPVAPNVPTRTPAASTPSSPGPSPGAVSYANCDAARAAGAAPVHRGDPGYAAPLDRDGDGTGCDS